MVKEEQADDDSNGLVEVAAGVVCDVGAMCDDEAPRDDTWEPTYDDDDNGPVAISMGMVGDAGAMCGVEVERGTIEAEDAARSEDGRWCERGQFSHQKFLEPSRSKSWMPQPKPAMVPKAAKWS